MKQGGVRQSQLSSQAWNFPHTKNVSLHVFFIVHHLHSSNFFNFFPSSKEAYHVSSSTMYMIHDKPKPLPPNSPPPPINSKRGQAELAPTWVQWVVSMGKVSGYYVTMVRFEIKPRISSPCPHNIEETCVYNFGVPISAE